MWAFFKQLNRDLLNESFHVCAEHSTIIRSITKIQTKSVKYIYSHSKQSHMMGGVKYETVSDVLTFDMVL